MSKELMEIAIAKYPIAELSHNLSANAVQQHVRMVQEVMQAVMKPEVHFGKIPGADKPTLYKAGAEVLCMTFRISDDYEIDDMSSTDMIRYRVKCIGKHQITDQILGQGMGEASSGEEKYKWRKAVCIEEFEETPITSRRKKYGSKKGGGHYTVNQIRTEPSDLANTVLKMACKRAKIAMTLNVTAASDMFSQDLTDLPEEIRDGLIDEEQQINTALMNKWIRFAQSAPDEASLTEIWQAGVIEFRAAKDIDGANAFKKAVGERGMKLKDIVAKAIATMIPPATTEAVKNIDDDFVRAMEEAEAKASDPGER